MLQIAFGQAKYFSDNFSDNIKCGEWLYHAPLGYKRNHDKGNIEIIPQEAELVKQLFQYYSQSTSLEDNRKPYCLSETLSYSHFGSFKYGQNLE